MRFRYTPPILLTQLLISENVIGKILNQYIILVKKRGKAGTGFDDMTFLVLEGE